MGKKYFDTKENTLESSILSVWTEAAKKVDETNKNDKSDDGDGMDAVQPKAVKKKFKDRKDKDIDNDGDTDDSDEYLHNRRKTVSKAVKGEGNAFGMALKAAKDKGEKTFVVAGKTYEVKEEDDLDEAKVKEYKGIAYFENRKDAESHMKKFAPKGRIVEYERGYAIQVRTSGPYLNKSGKINEGVDLDEIAPLAESIIRPMRSTSAISESKSNFGINKGEEGYRPDASTDLKKWAKLFN